MTDLAGPDDPYDSLPPGVEAPRVRTPLTAMELRSAAILGHREATGQDIERARLRGAWCMFCVEHAGHDAAGKFVHGWAVWCFDLGNIGRGKWSGDTFGLTAIEDLASGPRSVTQQLRAHSSATAGAADFWAFLLGAWPTAIEAMDRGDLAGVAHELKHAHPWPYYTAPEQDYARGLLSWSRDYDRRWP